MNRHLIAIACFSLAMASARPAAAQGKDDPRLNQAYQDHIAYVVTFAMPVLIEKCAANDAGYLQEASSAYFRFVNENQDRIERGRLLTLAELEPGQTLRDYREKVIASRISPFDASDEAKRRHMCERALGVLQGARLPGEWPARD